MDGRNREEHFHANPLVFELTINPLKCERSSNFFSCFSKAADRRERPTKRLMNCVRAECQCASSPWPWASVVPFWFLPYVYVSKYLRTYYLCFFLKYMYNLYIVLLKLCSNIYVCIAQRCSFSVVWFMGWLHIGSLSPKCAQKIDRKCTKFRFC